MDGTMTVVLKSLVPDGANGMTLNRYVRRAWPMMPAFAARDYLKRKQARVNGERASGECVLRSGDELEVYVNKKHAPARIHIIRENGGIVAFMKPAGLPVDVDADGVGEDTALLRLRQVFPTARLTHRLDAGTGGVMLAAKDDEAYTYLTDAFREHKIEKKYMALVSGRMPEKARTLNAYLTKNAENAVVSVTDKPVKGSKPIETRYTVISEMTVQSETVSELEICIPTGRTHQIRAHMAHIRHPLIGDDKYGDRRVNKLLKANDVCLWCLKLTCGGVTYESEKPEWRITTQI